MVAIIKILFSRDSSRNHIHVTLGPFSSIFGQYWKRLQAYMVRIGFEIASIFSLLWNWDCIHLWMPFIINMASILSPFNQDCKHIWFLLCKLLQSYVVQPYTGHTLFIPIVVERAWENIFWQTFYILNANFWMKRSNSKLSWRPFTSH